MTQAPAVALRAVRPGDADGMLAVLDACQCSWRAFAPAGWEPPPVETAHWVGELAAGRDWTWVAEEPADDAPPPARPADSTSARAGRARIVGFASWGEARDETLGPAIAGVANLNALFVHPNRSRRGVASRLLDAAVAAMRDAGCRRGRLYTPQGAPAEGFYAVRGWSLDGRLAWHHILGFAVVGYALEL